jgi:hypothetical protein
LPKAQLRIEGSMNAAPEVFRDANAHALIVFRVGRTKLHALALHNPPVRILRLEKADRPCFTPLTYHGRPYPLARAVRAFRAAARALGITKAARIVLRALAENAATTKEEETMEPTATPSNASAEEKRKEQLAKKAAKAREWRAAKKAAIDKVKAGAAAPKKAKAAKKADGAADERKITLLVKDNPKREGTKAHAAFSKYETGMTVAEFLKKGGSLVDLSWDARHKFITVKS